MATQALLTKLDQIMVFLLAGPLEYRDLSHKTSDEANAPPARGVPLRGRESLNPLAWPVAARPCAHVTKLKGSMLIPPPPANSPTAIDPPG